MHHAYTLLVMASIIASTPTYASGSCLSYGHSCWGAHGKRSGDPGTSKFFLSKLIPGRLSERQARLTEYLLSQQRQQQRTPEDSGEKEAGREEVLLMEQPLKLYQILDQIPRFYESKTQLSN